MHPVSGINRARLLTKTGPTPLYTILPAPLRQSPSVPLAFAARRPCAVVQFEDARLCRCVFQDHQKRFGRDKLWVSDFGRYFVVLANFYAEGDAFVADKCCCPSDELPNVELGFSTKCAPQLFCYCIGCGGLSCDRCSYGYHLNDSQVRLDTASVEHPLTSSAIAVTRAPTIRFAPLGLPHRLGNDSSVVSLNPRSPSPYTIVPQLSDGESPCHHPAE
jgi:hypothetical protein